MIVKYNTCKFLALVALLSLSVNNVFAQTAAQCNADLTSLKNSCSAIEKKPVSTRTPDEKAFFATCPKSIREKKSDCRDLERQEAEIVKDKARVCAQAQRKVDILRVSLKRNLSRQKTVVIRIRSLQRQKDIVIRQFNNRMAQLKQQQDQALIAKAAACISALLGGDATKCDTLVQRIQNIQFQMGNVQKQRDNAIANWDSRIQRVVDDFAVIAQSEDEIRTDLAEAISDGQSLSCKIKS